MFDNDVSFCQTITLETTVDQETSFTRGSDKSFMKSRHNNIIVLSKQTYTENERQNYALISKFNSSSSALNSPCSLADHKCVSKQI